MKKKKKSTKKTKVDQQERKAIYKNVDISICHGKKALTATQSKELLGWREVPEGVTEGVISYGNTKAFLENNITNRPISNSNLFTLKQEILRKKWRLNGETIIIGRTGLILDGQHTLIALILAVEDWKENPDKYPDWESEPTLEKIVVFGIDESDDTINTINVGKPRSLADVLFRSEFLAKINPRDRVKLARILDYAIRLLWERTGVKTSEDAFGIRRTHSESLAFLGDHLKLVEAAKHIFEEDDNGSISNYLSLGYVTALLYLQATSKTDPDNYKGLNRNEGNLDISLWDDACDFWVEFSGGDQKLFHLKSSLDIFRIQREGGANNREEVIAVICKAWIGYLDNSVTEKSLELSYHKDPEGVTHLAECPTLGGIDQGNEFYTPESELTPEEVEQGKEDEKGKRTAKKSTKKKTKKKVTKDFRIGDAVWVSDKDDPDNDWNGTITEIYQGPAGQVAKVKTSDETGDIFETPISSLSISFQDGSNAWDQSDG